MSSPLANPARELPRHPSWRRRGATFLLALDALLILLPTGLVVGLGGLVIVLGGLGSVALDGDPSMALVACLAVLTMLATGALCAMVVTELVGSPAADADAAFFRAWMHVGAAIAVLSAFLPALSVFAAGLPLLVPYLHVLVHAALRARAVSRRSGARPMSEAGREGPRGREPDGRTGTAPAAQPVSGPDFQRLVGLDGWRRLRGDIRRRFSQKPVAGRAIHYRGVMETVECSATGWILAQLCRLIGTPFALHRGRRVPTAIRLIDDGAGGVVWQREYGFAGRAPVCVQSTKRAGADGSLLECVGLGLGMRLAVFEANGDLHFLSVRYFWRVGGRLLWLPRLLTPGTAHVIHRDLGDGRFRFTMTIHHALFGTLFHQGGVFCDGVPDAGDGS